MIAKSPHHNQHNHNHQRPYSHRQPKPWYHHLTLDLFVYVLSRSIFFPPIVWIFYLCLAAVHQHKTPLAYNTLVWVAFLHGWDQIGSLSHRWIYGPKRKWDAAGGNEVVVITGGGSGLGRTIAELLVLTKGVKVAVLDVKEADAEAEEMIENEKGGKGELWWGVCDVADEGQVREMASKIEQELGRPTVLINNAAIPVHGLPLIPREGSDTLSSTLAARTLNVNTLAHFNTLSAFLPYLTSSPKGGTIVTISSILAILSPSFLSDYNMSKAALSSLHHTLTHEISLHPDPRVRKNLKTVLVEPGQMDTTLFSGITSVPWYARFFGPVLEARDVAREIVKLLEQGESGVLRVPFYARCMSMYSVMPGMLQRLLRWFSGIDRAIIQDSLGKAR